MTQPTKGMRQFCDSACLQLLRTLINENALSGASFEPPNPQDSLHLLSTARLKYSIRTPARKNLPIFDRKF